MILVYQGVIHYVLLSVLLCYHWLITAHMLQNMQILSNYITNNIHNGII